MKEDKEERKETKPKKRVDPDELQEHGTVDRQEMRRAPRINVL